MYIGSFGINISGKYFFIYKIFCAYEGQEKHLISIYPKMDLLHFGTKLYLICDTQ